MSYADVSFFGPIALKPLLNGLMLILYLIYLASLTLVQGNGFPNLRLFMQHDWCFVL